MSHVSRWRRGLHPMVAVAALAAVLRTWRLGWVALIGDESYYWLWSEHLALSYYDNPAGVALMVRLSTLLAGQSEVGIRWLNATLGLGSVLLCYAVGAWLFSDRAGALGAAFLALGAPYVIVSRFVYTDALQLALLLLNLYWMLPFLIDSNRSHPSWQFWVVGLSMAALFNTKYNAYLYAAAMALFVCWRPTLLRDRRTWWAAGIAACGLLPVLLWNASHGWISFHWQFQHFFTETMHRATAWGNLAHTYRYLTPALALLSAVGAVQVRGIRQRVLLVPSAALILPVLFSPANSPRNLLAGVALLLPLASDAIIRWLTPRSKTLNLIVAGSLVLLTGIYGLGTVIGTMTPTALPHSPISTAIHRDGLGWRDAKALGLSGSIFALDYSIASQLRYYTGLSVQTAWGQYRLWGIPAICNPDRPDHIVQVVALQYVDPDLVSERLKATFGEVVGPIEASLGKGGAAKTLYVWTARDCAVDQETFLDRFDFLNLVRSGGTG